MHPLRRPGQLALFCDPRWLPVALSVAVLLSRAAFITDGFGSHPDEWRVVLSGAIFWLDGVYLPSRPPGYPFTELLMGGAALVGGPILCAALTTVASALGVLAFFLWIRRHAPEGPAWPSFALAFHPWFWASGITALDSAWGLALFVAALLALDAKRYLVGGFASGLAIGFRPTAVLWATVLFVGTAYTSRSCRAPIAFGGAAALPAGLALALILSGEKSVAGSSAFLVQFLAIDIRKLFLAAYRLVEFLGGLPIFIPLLVIVGLKSLDIWRRAVRREIRSIAPLAVVAALFLIQLVIISDKPEYLFPLLPLVLLTLAIALGGKDWAVLVALFLVGAFVTLDVGSWRHGHNPVLGFTRARGPVLYNVDRIQRETAAARRLEASRHRQDSVIREDATHHVFQNAYLLGLLRHASGRHRYGQDRPLLMEFLLPSREGPLTVREWKEYRVVDDSYAALYYPTSNTLIIQAGAPGSDQVLLTAARQTKPSSR